MIEGGKRLAEVLRQVQKEVAVGKSLSSLENLTAKLIKDQRGKASFKMVSGYHWATCLNINQGVVHGIPSDYKLKKADLLSIDVGIFYKELHTDMATTVLVGESEDKRKKHFLETGKKALRMAINQAKAGKRVGHISQAIEKEIKKAGYRPVESLTGHGVGEKLHEEPIIPCFLPGRLEKTDLLRDGMTLAIEIIYVQGSPELTLKDDNWTVETTDKKLAGLFEHTVLVRGQKPVILTT